MRRAEWKPLPRDPQSPFVWWWRDSRFCVFSLSAALLTLLAVSLFAPEYLGLTLIGVLTGALYFALAFLTIRKWRQGSWAVAELPPSPAPAETFPIEFAFFDGATCTGKDQGVASFVEGWLHVEGLRTTFSLRPFDTTRVGFSRRGFDQFELPGGQRVELRPLATSSTERATFSENVRVWHRFTIAPPSGEPLLPPLRVHPSAAAALLNTLGVCALGVTILIAFTIYILLLHPSAVGSLIMIVAAFTVVAQLGHKTLSDLRALGRLDRAALESVTEEHD